jgi:hypothetical protein
MTAAKKDVTVLGPDMGYVDLLNVVTTENLKKAHANGKEFQKTPIRPSAAGACTRELFYQLMQFHKKASYPTEVNEPELQRIFAMGHSVESHIIREFRQLADFFEIRYQQQVLSFEYLEAKGDPSMNQWLEGSLDLVFWSDKFKCVADIKSKKDKFSSFYKTNWDETTEKLRKMNTVTAISDAAFWVEDLDAFLEELRDPFFEANFLQLNLYANSQFLRERGVNHGAIIQYSKNDSRLREIRFKPSETLYKKVVGKFKSALDATAAGDPALAPRDFVLGSIKCAFCKYKTECWPDKDAKKEFFGTLPKKDWPRDTDRLGKAGEGLEKLFALYKEQASAESARKVTENAILKVMMDKNITKVRVGSGEVYEARQLKEGMVIRRTKV